MEESKDVVKTGESVGEGQPSRASSEFNSEDDLCHHLKEMKTQESMAGIRLKWELGNIIRDHYRAEGGYGLNRLGRIALKTGWSKSTLQKACQFAEKYSPDQVEALTRGGFQLAWRTISQNLCWKAQIFIYKYSRAQTPKQLNKALERRCYCCGRPMNGVKPFKTWRPDAPHDKESEKLIEEAESRYKEEGFVDVCEYLQNKYGEDKANTILISAGAFYSVGSSWECRDCIVLDDNEYFEMRFRNADKNISDNLNADEKTD